MQLLDDLDDISSILSDDGVILHPTDTIWGLGCSVKSRVAIERIYKIKKRPADKPCLLLVNSIEMLKNYVDDIHPRIETLLTYHNKPLTIIYPNGKNVPDKLLNEDGNIAIRLVHHTLTRNIINHTGAPIVSTSANFSGADFPNSFDEIDPALFELVDYTSYQERNSKAPATPSVIASYNEKGDLVFIRN